MSGQLNDSLDDIFGAPSGDVRTAAVRAPASYTPRDFTEKCPKCAGTGSWRGRGKCFACKGVGKQTFKTSPETRSAARQVSATRRAAVPADNMAMFQAAHPEVLKWLALASDRFDFAGKMIEAIRKFGSLTEGQMAAVMRCIERDVTRGQERETREATAPVISIARIEEAFAAVTDAGLKYPKLNLATFEFKPASARGNNVGSIYVTEGGEYLGKVTAGKFICSRACTPAQQEQILEAAADPEAAAIAYGKRTGTCACCRRELSDPASVEAGIGPICATKWGW